MTPDARRIEELGLNSSAPPGQLLYDGWLLRLLRGFKARTASDLDGTMTVATQPLQDDEIVSLVHFLASLGTETGR